MITSRSRNSMSSSSTSTEASSSSSGSSDQPRQPRRRSAGNGDGSSSPPAVGSNSTDDRFTQAEHRERDQVRTHSPSDEVPTASTPLRQRRLPASFWQEPNVPRRRITSKSVNCDERPGKIASGFDGVRARQAAALHTPGGLRTDTCCSDWNRMICYDALHSAVQPHHQSFSAACNHSGTSFPAAELSSYFPCLQTTTANWTSGVRSGGHPAAPLTPPSPSVSAAFVGGDDVLSAYLRLCSCAALTPSYDVTNKLDGGNADTAVDSLSCQLGRTLYYPLPAVLPSVRNLVASPLLAAAVSSDLTSCGAAHRTHRFHPYT